MHVYQNLHRTYNFLAFNQIMYIHVMGKVS